MLQALQGNARQESTAAHIRPCGDEAQQLIQTLSSDGSQFLALAEWLDHVPEALAEGIWRVTMPGLDGEQWLFQLGPGIFALTTQGRVVRNLESAMAMPAGYALVTLRASGSSTELGMNITQANNGPFLRVLWPDASAELKQLIGWEHNWQSAGFLVRADVWNALEIGVSLRPGSGRAGTGGHDSWPLPIEWLPAICEAAVVQIRDSVDVIKTRGQLLTLLSLVLDHLAKHRSTAAEAMPHAALRHAFAARDVLIRALSSPPSQRKLAKMVGTNERKLVESFRMAFGTSPARFVRNSRMEWARSLLLTGEVSVTQLADTVGFADIATFSRAFRAYFGVSPRQMRDQAIADDRATRDHEQTSSASTE